METSGGQSRKIAAVGLRCHLMPFLAFGMVEVRGLFVHCRGIYLIVTVVLGRTQVDEEWQLGELNIVQSMPGVLSGF